MLKKSFSFWLVSLLVLALLTGCSGGSSGSESSSSGSSSTNNQNSGSSGDTSGDTSGEIQIVLNGNSISANSSRVAVDGSEATIQSAGTYYISGSLNDGRIVVDTDGAVNLILNGVDINNSSSAALLVNNAESTAISLAANTANYCSDGGIYVVDDVADEEVNAVIFCSSDLTISGTGSLTVDGNYNDGITGKDGLVIESGNITVNAADDGIRGKDYLEIKDGNFTVTSGGNGMISDNETDTSLGYITIKGGVFNITAGGDAISAQNKLAIKTGTFTLTSGGGSNITTSPGMNPGYNNGTVSAKGLKGIGGVTIENGTFAINSADDAIHSNGTLTINGGVINLASGDDGIHADSTLEVNGGEINISKAYEGMESRSEITINNGELHVVASDDAINIAGGTDASGAGAMPGQGDMGMETAGAYYLNINGGYLAVNAGGDGLDCGGPITMSGGQVIVNGPTNNGNGPLDYLGTFNISGGTLIAVGSSGMAQALSASSSQYSFLMNFSSTQQAGTLIHLEGSGGADILTFKPAKTYQSIVFSSPDLTGGAAYDLYLGGSVSGTTNDGWYQNGSYTPGALYQSLTLSGMVTKSGSLGMMR